MPNPKCCSWIEIDADALRKNIKFFKSILYSEVKLGCVLKSNAYGHGLEQVVSIIHGHVDSIHLIAPTDALWVRRWEKEQGLNPIPILVLGALHPSELVPLAQEGVSVVLGDEGWWPLPDGVLSALNASHPLKIHIHLDSGLGREGFLPDRMASLLASFQKDQCSHGKYTLAGVMTHFSNTEDVTEQSYALEQLKCFQGLKKVCDQVLGPHPLEWHTAASAASFVLPQGHQSAVRIGISLYGLWPSPETRLSYQILRSQSPHDTLNPVLSWKVQSQYIKWLPMGAYVGYGCTFRCERPTRIAVLPVGYFDGYPRLLSGKAYALVDGYRCPVLGRVMMNHIVIDVTVVPETTATVCAILIGRSGDQLLGVETLASWAETIHYECVARLGSHVPRVIVNA